MLHSLLAPLTLRRVRTDSLLFFIEVFRRAHMQMHEAYRVRDVPKGMQDRILWREDATCPFKQGQQAFHQEINTTSRRQWRSCTSIRIATPKKQNFLLRSTLLRKFTACIRVHS